MSDRLIEIFSSTLNVPAAELNDETTPSNTPQWDSLANMLLIAAIEETFGIELSTDDFENMRSLGAIRIILRKYVLGEQI